MKRKILKYVILCVFSIILLYISFMTGRYSWLIQKPTFLLSSKENFFVDKAKEFLIEEGLSEKPLNKPWVRNAIIVYFDDSSGFNYAQVVLDKTSGEFLQGSW